jgi:hypothetical protein
MSAVELDEELLGAVRREAARRGVDVSDVVSEAVQRFVVGADLRDLLAEFRRQDAAAENPLSEDEALRIAADERRAGRDTPR